VELLRTAVLPIIVIVIMITVPRQPLIRDSHFKRPLQAEGHYGVPRNSYRPAMRFTAVNRSDNPTDKTVIAL
jgi:hypothetical protein